MSDAFIVDGIRTAIGSHAGSLSAVRADDMAALVIGRLLERNPGVPKECISEVIFGCANQAGEDNRNVARMASLLAGVPHSVPGETVNRLCASGLSAVVNAARAVRLGDGGIYVAGGVEQMTRAPFVLGKSATPFGRTAEIFDTSIGWRFVNPRMKEMFGVDSMGETAENVAEKWKISRADQDKFAAWSQHKAAEAQKRGRHKPEITPVPVPKGKGETIQFENDEFARGNTTLETLAKLKPAFKAGGTVTAGNSSGINDGACALLVASEKALKECKLTPKARLVSSAVVGVEPRIMGVGPVEAAKQALQRAGISFKDLAVIELNEAFAAQSLACVREWGLADDDARINPNGGAIALGHPLGMSGARLVLTAMHELHERKERYALVTMCIGVGQGMAAVIERI